ncbi:hypothetical protein MHY85_03075 [Cellulomonas sp. ACRRI]|uniref:hypothetical protein n=1 Tax=Cellulomonas sp. ACRRI TaxID=2918188 RepID=UPI001EF348EE|nr:hypothetical protein [Cellulomonas sp. ACRRI]MCG7284954.1 hypothetical protein [Cellulomonas sp. ACRRI]
MAGTWRYVCFAEPSGAYLGEVQLAGVRLTEVLSGPDRLTGTVVGDAPAWLRPWECSVYAENPAGQVAVGGLLTAAGGVTGQRVAVDVMGRAGYPGEMPWLGDTQALVQVDPLAVVRMIWAHLQSQPNGNLRVQVDSTTSPVRVGTDAEQVEFTTETGESVSFEAGPFRLEWWSTTDLGSTIDKLATETPFDYAEDTSWNADRTALVHRLRLGYPALGARRTDLRLVVGENVILTPDLTGGDDLYATEVHALGAGTGRTRVRAQLTRAAAGVRRVLVYTDTSARTRDDLSTVARADLAWRDGSPLLDQITVIDHPNTPIAALAAGDEVFVAGQVGDYAIDRWVRITSIETSPGSDRAVLDLVEV